MVVEETELLTEEHLTRAQNTLVQLGMSESPAGSMTNKIMATLAQHRGIDVSLGPTPRRMLLSYGTTSYRFGAGATNYNKTLSRRCTIQKDVTSALLRTQGVDVPENAVFEKSEAMRAWRWASAFSVIVVKPVDGMKGKNVFLNITDQDNFLRIFNYVAEHYGSALVEEQMPGTEHRAFVLKNRLIAVTRREPAHIRGDGQQTIEELIAQKNSDLHAIHQRLTLDDAAVEYLADQGYAPDDVPAAGMRAYLRRTSNLATGGDAVDATEEITCEERDFIEKAARAVPGLRSAGFDVLLPRDGTDHRPVILEMNGGPMLSMHHFPRRGTPRNAVGALLDAMFPATASSNSP